MRSDIFGRLSRLLHLDPAADRDASDRGEAGDRKAAGGGARVEHPDPISQDLVGGRHALAYLRDLVRGNQLRRDSLPQRINDEHPPVLLIHGFLGTRGSMRPLERHLEQDGRCVFSFNLGLVNIRDIRRSAVLIRRKIESILAQVPVHKIDIVAHSMGGLIGLYYIKKLGGHDKVRKMVMLGTPIGGTWVGYLGVATVGIFSPGAFQILPGSAFLAELADGPLPDGVQVYTIAAQRDWLCPPSATVLPGARRIEVPLGHSSLVVSELVYAEVRRALDGTIDE